MIKVNHLQYQYPKSSGFAINGLTFAIEKGEVFGFLGPSGSGKSTTQKILFKLLSGYKGSAIIDNKSLTEWDNSIYHKIGVCFELPNHYLKLTALENLNFFKAFYKNTLNPMDLLERVGLQNDAHKKVASYSKGMKMRLNFIRSLIHNPEILPLR